MVLAYPGRWLTTDFVLPSETKPSTVAVTLYGAWAQHDATRFGCTSRSAPSSHTMPPHAPAAPPHALPRRPCARGCVGGRGRLGRAANHYYRGEGLDAGVVCHLRRHGRRRHHQAIHPGGCRRVDWHGFAVRGLLCFAPPPMGAHSPEQPPTQRSRPPNP